MAMIPNGVALMLVRLTMIWSGIRWWMISQPKKPAAEMMKSRLMVCRMEAQKIPGRSRSVRSLYKNPSKSA